MINLCKFDSGCSKCFVKLRVRMLIHYIVVIAAIIPGTISFVFCLGGILLLVPNVDLFIIPFLYLLLCGVLGYAGLVMLLFRNKDRDNIVINFVCLLHGVVGYLLFIIITGGNLSWEWAFRDLEEITEWKIFFYPFIVSLFYLGILGNRIAKKYVKQN